MSATTDTPHNDNNNGGSGSKAAIIRTKKFSFIGRSTASRSKSSPALITVHGGGRRRSSVDKKKKHFPSCHTVIDLTLHKGEDLKNEIRHLMASMFPDWFDNSKLELQRLSGAMTNAVFFVDAGVKKVLLRVYGVGCDQILDREKELEWLARLSQLHIGPKLLGTFGNGRFEEYLESTTLTYQDIRTRDYSVVIASRLAQLHSLVQTFPPNQHDLLEVWPNVDKWYNLLVKEKVAIRLAEKNKAWADQLEKMDLEKLGNDIELCKKLLNKVNSPTVFAHNDAQYGNILKVKTTGELVVIDFEYAGYNPRGYDIANHFCEWMYNYHSDEPAVMHEDKYPTTEEQSQFLSSYIDAAGTNEDLQSVMKEVALWRMACHLFWGLWGLVQANLSDIDFDYFLYSTFRINTFRRDLENALNDEKDIV